MSIGFDRHELTASICRESFEDFCKAFWSQVPGAGEVVWNWHMTVLCTELQTVAERVFKNLPREYDSIFNVSPGTSKSTLCSILFPAWVWTRMPNARIITASHTDTLVLDFAVKSRYVIQSELYRRCFPGIDLSSDQAAKHYYTNVHGGDRFSCTVAGKSPTGMHAHFLICDDPLDPKKAISEAELKIAQDFFDAVLPGRKVDKMVSVTFLIAQRLHEADPPGHLLAKAKKAGAAPIRHICLPAEIFRDEATGKWSPGNVAPVELASNYVDGLMDPVRLPRSILMERKTDGEYSYCTPGFTPILMSDWSEKKIENIQIGDEVVGYTFGVECIKGHHNYRSGCASIVRSVVTAKNKREAEVVKMTMESGRIVYCTPNHKWWTRRKAGGVDARPPYRPAKVGSKLFSVYDPPPEPTFEDQRLLDWLGGILDGEGACKHQTVISQSPEHNPEVWNKIRTTLKTLRIDYSATRWEGGKVWRRKKGKKEMYLSEEKEKGSFVLRGGRSMKFRIMSQCLLAKRHQVLSTIWASPAKVAEKSDRVVRIEAAGKMTVYGLTTTTGNYVAWGYASQNSGQFLQNPVPLGGGMFKVEYFNLREKTAPYNAKRILYVDRASTEDGGCATAMVLMAKDSENRYYVEDCIHGHWEPFRRNQILLAAAEAARRRYGPSNEPWVYLEAEGGASGKEAFLGVARLLAGYKVKEHKIAGMGDKAHRAEPWSSMLAAKNVVFCNVGDWDFDGYVKEHCLFPKGRLKDRVDASAGAFCLLAKMSFTASPLRTYNLQSKKRDSLKVVLCSKEDLLTLVIEKHPVLLLGISSPGEEASCFPLAATGIQKLLSQTSVSFADLEPRMFQDRWGEVIPSYGLPPEKVVLSRETAIKVWAFITKVYDPPPGVIVIATSEREDPRALSVACALCDSLRLERKKSIYVHSDPDNRKDKEPPNRYVYELLRQARGLVSR